MLNYWVPKRCILIGQPTTKCALHNQDYHFSKYDTEVLHYIRNSIKRRKRRMRTEDASHICKGSLAFTRHTLHNENTEKSITKGPSD